MDRGACQATVHMVTKSWTGLKKLSTHTHTSDFISLSTIFSRSIHIAANGNISLFSWLSNIPLYLS